MATSEERLKTLTPDTQIALSQLLSFAEMFGYQPQVRSALRTCAQQNAIYAQGRTKPGPIVSGARGCMSWHVLGRAADLNLGEGTTREDYEFLGEEWERMGGVWGGRFSNIDDPGHYEWHPGVTIEEVCPNPDRCREVVESEFAPRSNVVAAVVVAALGLGTALHLYRRN